MILNFDQDSRKAKETFLQPKYDLQYTESSLLKQNTSEMECQDMGKKVAISRNAATHSSSKKVGR